MTKGDDLRKALTRALHDGGGADITASLADELDFVKDKSSLTSAAVLIAVTDRPNPGVILVKRPDYMRNHPGQIALPGGKIDPGDIDATDAALREAHEEVLLERRLVDIIGPTDHYHSGSGYRIQPIVGVIPPDLPLVSCPEEVEEWFEAPLEFILDPANQHLKTTQWGGRQREFYEIPWQGRRIWGITAGILVNLSKRLRWTI